MIMWCLNLLWSDAFPLINSLLNLIPLSLRPARYSSILLLPVATNNITLQYSIYPANVFVGKFYRSLFSTWPWQEIMLLFVKEKYKVVTFDMQQKSILANQCSEWSEEQTPSSLTHTHTHCSTPTRLPQSILVREMERGINRAGERRGAKQMSGQSQMWKKKEEKNGRVVKREMMSRQDGQMRSARERRSG